MSDTPILDEMLPRLSGAIKEATRSISKEYDANESGFNSAVERVAEARLKGTELQITNGQAGSWKKGINQNRELGKGGLSFVSFMALAITAYPSTPAMSYALLSLHVSGCWNPKKLSVDKAKTILESFGESVTGDRSSEIAAAPEILSIEAANKLLKSYGKTIVPSSEEEQAIYDEQINRIEKTLNTVKEMVQNKMVQQVLVAEQKPDPISIMLQKELEAADLLDFDALENVTKELFAPRVAIRLMEILRGDGGVIQSDDFWGLSALLNKVLPDQGWNDTGKIKKLVRREIAATADLNGGQKLP